MEDFIKYYAFVEAVRTGSLTATALTLGYTQPAISHMIGSLEKSCGFPLLYRNKQGVTLTEAGERVYKLCREILAKQGELEATVSQINGAVSGTLRIGCYISVLMPWMYPLADKLTRVYPELRLRFWEGNRSLQLELLKSNDIDVGILSNSAPVEYDFIPIHKDPIVAILPPGHPLCEKDVLTVDDMIYSEQFIQSEWSYVYLLRVLGERFTSAKSSISTKSDQTQLRLVKNGLGIGFIGEMLARSDDKVVIRELNPPGAQLIGLTVPTWKPVTPALREFIRAVCDAYQDEEYKGTARQFI